MMDDLSSIMHINAAVHSPDESDAGSIRKEEMGYYKTALKLYKATSLCLQTVSQKIKNAYVLPEHLSTSDILKAKTKDLHNDVALLNCLYNVSNIIQQNYASLNVMHYDNSFKSSIKKEEYEIAFFAKSVINLYSHENNELEQIEAKRTYIEILEFYQNHLEKLKATLLKPRDNEEDLSQLEKCKRQVEKINIMRALKSILIAKFANDESRLPELQKLRSSSRRNLSLEDFEETWDICYK